MTSKRRRPPIVCPICQRPFRTNEAATLHMRAYHATELRRRAATYQPQSKEEGLALVKK